MSDKERFLTLRSRIFQMIRKELEEGHYCKSYEGCLEVLTEYPNFFEDDEAKSGPKFYRITLHCYVLGLSRHYDFDGKTMEEALDNLERTLDAWEANE